MNHKDNHHINCPVCKQSDQVLLLEELYFGLIQKDPAILSKIPPSQQHKTLLNQIQPPSLDRLPFWLITPPDTLFLALVIMVLLVFLFTSTPLTLETGFLPILIVILYLLFRRKIIHLFHQKKNERNAVIEIAQHAADDWSAYFICLQDMTIFSGHIDNHFPVSELQLKLS